MATIANLTFSLDESWSITLDCFDSTGAVLDLTGATVKWRMADQNGNIIFDYDADPNVVITQPPTLGQAVISVTPDDQSAANAAVAIYFYEAQAVLADGTVTDQARGSLTVLGSLFA